MELACKLDLLRSFARQKINIDVEAKDGKGSRISRWNFERVAEQQKISVPAGGESSQGP